MKYEELFREDKLVRGDEAAFDIFVGAYTSQPRKCYRCGCDTIFIHMGYGEWLCSIECQEDLYQNGRIYGGTQECPHHQNGIEKATKRLK